MVGAVVPYALSVHGFIDKVGNYAGFAAVIAVALLVIMVFVNAREAAGLRDRAEDAEERLYRLEYHAEQLSRHAAAVQAAQTPQALQMTQAVPTTQAAPARAAVAATPPARVAAPPAAARRAMPVAAPAGVGAPALSSATRLIPLAGPLAGPLPGPLDPAATSNGATSTVPVAPAPATAAGGNGSPEPLTPPPVPPPVLGSGSVPPPRLAPRPAAAAAPTTGRAPRRNYGRPTRAGGGGVEESGSRIGKGSVAIAVVLVAVIAAAVVLVITHHGSGSGNARQTAAHSGHTTKGSASGKHGAKRTVRVDPTKVTVAVLNGTSTDNLAADVSAKLNHVGFQQGDTANYSTQTQATTTVGYLPDNSAQGYAVAKALGLSKSHVHPVSTAARTIACAATPTACPDQVVVVVGADLESDA